MAGFPAHQLERMSLTNKLCSVTVDAISILLSHPKIFIDNQDGKAETKTSNKRNSEGKSQCREQRK